MDLSPAWTPVRVNWPDGRAEIDWCFTEGVDFSDPFFDQTVERCLRHPYRLLFRRQSTIEELARFVSGHPGLPPAGFVFHMSRCGSTLVSQMLAAVPDHLVLSEPPPLDAILRARHVPAAERVQWLRWMVAALGQGRPPRQRLFVKFDAWSALDIDVVRQAFPDVPWLFVFRDPVEVLVSHRRHRGAHVIPGVLPSSVSGVADDDATRIDPDEFAARALARICEAALDWEDDPHGTFVNHRRLIPFVSDDLPHRWGLPLDGDDIMAMATAAGLDAKNPVLRFECDGAAKRAEATPAIEVAARRWLAPVYDRLEAVRAN